MEIGILKDNVFGLSALKDEMEPFGSMMGLFPLLYRKMESLFCLMA